MGDLDYDSFIRDLSRPHTVTLTTPFWLCETLVTQSLWQAVNGTTPWRGGVEDFATEGPDHPATFMTWTEASDFCDLLSELPDEKAAGRVYRLATDAEWEYACRARSTKIYPFGNRDKLLGNHAWFNDNSDWMTHPVAQKEPNDFGLLDMLGNVWEWVQDVWRLSYPQGDVTDPEGPERGRMSVIRGGSWGSHADGCRPSSRRGNIYYKRDDDVGFRVAFDYVEQQSPRRSGKKRLLKKLRANLAASSV